MLYRAVREDPCSKSRRHAYYALEPLYQHLEDSLCELIRTRNERARVQGYRTYADMRLGFEGFTPARLEELAEATLVPAPGRIRALRDTVGTGVGQSGLYPWDLTHLQWKRASIPGRYFPQRPMLPTVLSAIRLWGFRTDLMRFRIDFHDIPMRGLTLALDPPRDIRIVVHPQRGWEAYRVMFHELGHAVHAASIKAPSHLLRLPENLPGFGGFCEGIGGLFSEIAKDAGWLASRPGVTPRRAESFVSSCRDSDLIDAASIVSRTCVEQALYRKPDRNPVHDIQRIERRVLGYDAFPPLSFVDSLLVDWPLSVPNYLLATLFHYQLARTLRGLFEGPLWPNAKVGPWLTRTWFAPGSLYDWAPRVREVTGSAFGAQDFQAAFKDPQADV